MESKQVKPEELKQQPETDEARWRAVAVAYTRFLRSKHPNWTEAKMMKKVASHLNIKFV